MKSIRSIHDNHKIEFSQGSEGRVLMEITDPDLKSILMVFEDEEIIEFAAAVLNARFSLKLNEIENMGKDFIKTELRDE